MATMEEYLLALETLRANREAPFVRRMLNPGDYPALDIGGRPATVQLSTHGYGPKETYKGVHLGGREWVVPNIVMGDDGKLIRRGPEDHLWDREQIARGNAIPFDSAERARALAEGSWKRSEVGLLERALDTAAKDYAGPLQQALFGEPSSMTRRLFGGE